MEEISTLENDIKGIKEAIDAKNAPMMVSDYSRDWGQSFPPVCNKRE